MALSPPLHFKNWIDENRHLLQPPVGMQSLYRMGEDFIVMAAGGPITRKDYHVNQGEEFYYQIVGDILLRTMDNGRPVDVPIREGELFVLPPRVPHSPQRPANTFGIVIEKVRTEEETDGFVWFCESCGNKLYDEYFHVEDIAEQLPPVMQRFYESEQRRRCTKCGTLMSPPAQNAG